MFQLIKLLAHFCKFFLDGEWYLRIGHITKSKQHLGMLYLLQQALYRDFGYKRVIVDAHFLCAHGN